MRLPRLKDLSPFVGHGDLHRGLEAMRAGLRSDPPDTLAEDWEETMAEVERLLVEIEDGRRYGHSPNA